MMILPYYNDKHMSKLELLAKTRMTSLIPPGSFGITIFRVEAIVFTDECSTDDGLPW